MKFIHSLFENYSKRGLTNRTDRRVAASGIETRIADALKCKGSKYGIFKEHLHRNLLWQSTDSGTKRITYDSDTQVPSWSWMACSGGITFMDVKMGSVSWVDGLAFDDERDCALKADVGKLHSSTIKHSIIIDVINGQENTKHYFVVVGRTETDVNEEQYYVLVVVPTGEDGEYRRVGAGMVRAGCVEKLRADVRIV